jgi:RNA polymerase sigma-70 factor (ECF subfamily)
MERLDSKYRLVLEKVYLQGYSQADAAEELDIPLGTVKTRLRAAIIFLREELKDEKSLFFGILLLMLIILAIWQ